jgi:ribosomal protein S18 acetylase RimI-like enzyme
MPLLDIGYQMLLFLAIMAILVAICGYILYRDITSNSDTKEKKRRKKIKKRPIEDVIDEMDVIKEPVHEVPDIPAIEVEAEVEVPEQNETCSLITRQGKTLTESENNDISALVRNNLGTGLDLKDNTTTYMLVNNSNQVIAVGCVLMIDRFDLDSKFSSLNPADADQLVCILYNLCVAPEYRRMGFGRQLIAAIEQGAKAAGKGKMVLYVKQNNPDAGRLYQRLGYQSAGTQEDTIRMIKDL